MVSKIPPVYNQQTASNISIEHGVEVKGLKSCNLKLRQSSAFHGVRLWKQQKPDVYTPMKFEIIPQSNLPVESGSIHEFHTILQEPASYINTNRVVAQAAKEETAVSPFITWEENFQDLSGWCMVNMQERYDFPTGEPTMASNLTDLKNEDSKILTSAECVTNDLMQTVGSKINSSVDRIIDAHKSMPVTCTVLPQLNCSNTLTEQKQQQQQIYFQNDVHTKSIINEIDDLKSSGNNWIDRSIKVDVNNGNLARQQLKNVGIIAPETQLSFYYQQVLNIDVEPKQEQIQPPENQDVFQNLENVASNDFDLLSYLYEDDISAPNDSISTDSSGEINSLSKIPNVSAHIVVSPKTYEPIVSSTTSTSTSKSKLQTGLPYSQESPNSTISSTSSISEISIHPSSCQLQTIVKQEKVESSPMERRSTRSKRIQTNSNSNHNSTSRNMSRKRTLSNESESDDDGYRDTREKNNEASRKSRMNKKTKEQEMAKKAIELEKDNRVLKMKVEELEKLVSSMRNALLRSALKKEIKSNII